MLQTSTKVNDTDIEVNEENLFNTVTSKRQDQLMDSMN